MLWFQQVGQTSSSKAPLCDQTNPILCPTRLYVGVGCPNNFLDSESVRILSLRDKTALPYETLAVRTTIEIPRNSVRRFLRWFSINQPIGRSGSFQTAEATARRLTHASNP
jgi:hypothetical protein